MPVEEELIQPMPPAGNVGNKKETKPALNSIVTPVVVIAAIMVAVASGFYVTRMINAPKVIIRNVPATPAKPVVKPSYIKLKPEFTVNLNSSGQYLETEIVLKAQNSKIGPELDKMTPELRDKIISILASQSYTNLLTQAGKEGLKAQIIAGVNSLITKGKIIDVYFNSFIMQ